MEWLYAGCLCSPGLGGMLQEMGKQSRARTLYAPSILSPRAALTYGNGQAGHQSGPEYYQVKCDTFRDSACTLDQDISAESLSITDY